MPLSGAERESFASGATASMRVICQYQPESGRSNKGSPSAEGSGMVPAVALATSATMVFR